MDKSILAYNCEITDYAGSLQKAHINPSAGLQNNNHSKKTFIDNQHHPSARVLKYQNLCTMEFLSGPADHYDYAGSQQSRITN